MTATTLPECMSNSQSIDVLEGDVQRPGTSFVQTAAEPISDEEMHDELEDISAFRRYQLRYH